MSSELPEAGAPHTVHFAKVRQLLLQAPFQPFRIATTSGRTYDVPTADHASVTPISRLIHVSDDCGATSDIHSPHVSAIESLPRPRRRRRHPA